MPSAFRGLVDDAAIFPPGNADLEDAVAAWQERLGTPLETLVGSFVIGDHRLADLAALTGEVERPIPVSVVVGTGAGGLAPAASTVSRLPGVRLAGLEVALRDPDDLAGNARRIVAGLDQARDHGAVDDDLPVYVELPQADPTAGWLSAADEVAGAELRLKFRTGGVEADLFPASRTLAAWVDAALDRETPFKCTAGLHHAVRHADPGTGIAHHGFLNLLLATRRCFDGAAADEVVGLLEEREPAALLAAWAGQEEPAMAGIRRWFTGFGSCSVREPWTDLVGLGLVDDPDRPGHSTKES
ncbi:hypothetical protein [Nocardioides donggukensis]|uniref:Uncharacterized protein n=1 Tax=Nocardioides donggukensis TaxID=2774019 RepID=A0A927K7U6_9ACTN|nr:hypothetical protein [Nocardioides donggukensis]MBD8870770.1 hypothetical protein [Nocardioides donggukensis]